MVLLAGLLAAPQILPTLELIPLSERGAGFGYEVGSVIRRHVHRSSLPTNERWVLYGLGVIVVLLAEGGGLPAFGGHRMQQVPVVTNQRRGPALDHDADPPPVYGPGPASLDRDSIVDLLKSGVVPRLGNQFRIDFEP